jgi:hypothetical protein
MISNGEMAAKLAAKSMAAAAKNLETLAAKEEEIENGSGEITEWRAQWRMASKRSLSAAAAASSERKKNPSRK